MSHLDEGQLTCLLDDELTADERRAAEAHLGTCAECRRLYEEIRAFSGEADALVGAVELPRAPAALPARAAPVPIATPRGKPLPWRSLAWAATVILAIGLGYSMRRTGPGLSSSDIGAEKGIAERELTPPAAAPMPAESGPPAVGFTMPRRVDVAQPTAAPPARSEEAGPPPSPPAAMPAPAAPQRDNRLAVTAADAADAPAGATGNLEARAAVSTKQAAGEARAGAAPVVAFHQVAMEEAVRTLGGSIRLLDGLKPQRVLTGPGTLVPGASADAPVVRVVYEDPPGRELWLDQQRLPLAEGARSGVAAAAAPLLVGDTVAAPAAQGMQSLRWMDQAGFRLALTGFLPTDSLRVLLRRVE